MAKGKQGQKIKLGGKQYNLKITMDMILKVEDKTRRNWLHPATFNFPNAREALTVAWIVMSEKDEDLTFDEVAKIVEPVELVKLTDVIAGAFKEDMPEPKADPLAENSVTNHLVGTASKQ